MREIFKTLGIKEHITSHQLEIFAKTLKDLPLEKCTREVCNLATGEIAWKAPEGKAFKVTGQFEVFFGQSDLETDYWSMPQPSMEYLKTLYDKDYKRFLKQSNRNENEAIRLLIDDIQNGGIGPQIYGDEMPVDFFIGKWLTTFPNLTSKELPEKLEIKVKNDIDAWCEKRFAHNIYDINPQSDIITSLSFESDAITEHWKQYHAYLVLGKSKIQLVDYQEKEKKFEAIRQKKKKGNKIIPPISVHTSKRPNNEDWELDLSVFFKGGEIALTTKSNDLIIVSERKTIYRPEKKK